MNNAMAINSNLNLAYLQMQKNESDTYLKNIYNDISSSMEQVSVR